MQRILLQRHPLLQLELSNHILLQSALNAIKLRRRRWASNKLEELRSWTLDQRTFGRMKCTKRMEESKFKMGISECRNEIIEDESGADVTFNKTLAHKTYLLVLLLSPQSKSGNAKTLLYREHQGNQI